MNKENLDIRSIRQEYTLNKLRKKNLLGNPILQFTAWLNDAIRAEVNEPTATVLSTIGKKGFPESRVVLLKSVEKDGFTFFTNYQSNKGAEISNHNKISLTFFWPEIQRQVRIKGVASKAEETISDIYFATRPRQSQLGAWASKQSKQLTSRKQLEGKYKNYRKKFEGELISRPKNWGGYIVKPVSVEFWQGRESRLHDRFLYKFENTKWIITRLAP